MNYVNIESRSELRSYLKRFEDKGHHIIALDIEAESNLIDEWLDDLIVMAEAV